MEKEIDDQHSQEYIIYFLVALLSHLWVIASRGCAAFGLHSPLSTSTALSCTTVRARHLGEKITALIVRTTLSSKSTAPNSVLQELKWESVLFFIVVDYWACSTRRWISAFSGKERLVSRFIITVRNIYSILPVNDSSVTIFLSGYQIY